MNLTMPCRHTTRGSWTLVELNVFTDGRVAGRGCPRPAPEEPCMGLSIHTARASQKESFDPRLYNFLFGMSPPMAIEMVHLKVACCVRPTVNPFHNVAEFPRC